MHRRTFLASALNAAVAAAGTSLGASARAPARRLKTVGLQLYTVRGELAADFEGTLARVAALGFREVEFAGYHKRAPAEVRAALKRHHLRAPSAHVSTAELRGPFEQSIEAAKLVGHDYLVLGYVPAEERRSLDDYKKLADLLNRAGRLARQAGLRFAYHNHDFEFETLEGQTPYDLLLALTDAREVELELDLYWISKAGRRPLEYFAKHPGRFPLLHVKDMDATPRRFFAEVGRGVIDFKSIFAQSRKAGVRHYFVENDEPAGSPFESLRVSFEYLRRLEF
jgi:sugar phosphate isomerase/epimerase